MYILKQRSAVRVYIHSQTSFLWWAVCVVCIRCLSVQVAELHWRAPMKSHTLCTFPRVTTLTCGSWGFVVVKQGRCSVRVRVCIVLSSCSDSWSMENRLLVWRWRGWFLGATVPHLTQKKHTYFLNYACASVKTSKIRFNKNCDKVSYRV